MVEEETNSPARRGGVRGGRNGFVASPSSRSDEPSDEGIVKVVIS